MKGLEASIILRSEMDDLNPSFRIDAEFYSTTAIASLRGIRKGTFDQLGDLTINIQHPIEVKREYDATGLLTVMAKNVRSNRVDMADRRYMISSNLSKVAGNSLKYGDVLITRTGANYGQTAPWLEDYEAYACADILIVRQPEVPAGYLSSFLECNVGKPLLMRGGYGAAQPHIAPPYLREIPVPRFPQLEARIEELFVQFSKVRSTSEKRVHAAEQELLAPLGLIGWIPANPLSFTATASEALSSKRMDAQFFRPIFDEVEDRLNATGNAVQLGNVLSKNTRGRQPSYADSGLPVVNSKHVRTNRVILTGNRLATAEGMPVKIKKGDVLLNGTGVGTIGRAAPYLHEQEALPDNHVTVLRSDEVDPLYLAVFLNSMLGQLQIERQIKGSSGQIELYPDDIAKIIFWDAPKSIQYAVRDALLAAFSEERRASNILGASGRSVEIAIEDGEPAALAYLDQVEEAG